MKYRWLLAMVLCGLGLSFGCRATVVPPVRAPKDPAAHEIFLVALGKENETYVVLERVRDHAPRVELWAARTSSRERQRFIELQPTEQEQLLAVAADPRAVIDRVRNSRIGKTIELFGLEWPTLTPGPSLETPYGVLEIDDVRIRLRGMGDSVTVGRLGSGLSPSATSWATGEHSDLVAVSLSYEGSPHVHDLRVFRLRHGAAELFAKRAFEHYEDEQYLMAQQLWHEARQLDPQAPLAAYNLACVLSLRGELAAALTQLEEAIQLGGSRMRDLARSDPDLTPLTGHPEFQKLLAAKRSGPPQGSD